MGAGLATMQVWNEEDAEDEVLAMVVRTGLHTSMGGMMRQVDYNAMPARNQLIRVGLSACQSKPFSMKCFKMAYSAIPEATGGRGEGGWGGGFWTRTGCVGGSGGIRQGGQLGSSTPPEVQGPLCRSSSG